MHPALKLLLVAITAIPAVALAAPAANAVEVSAEGGAHCPEVQADNTHNVTGGCLIEASSTQGNDATLANHVHATGEQAITTCENEFEARIHEAGDAWIFDQVLSGANCGITACDEATGAHYEWPAAAVEMGPFEALLVTFCVRPSGAPAGSSFGSCTIFIGLAEATAHTYVLGTLPLGPHEGSETTALGSRCSQNAATSITGQWQIHSTPIEITH